MSDEEFEVPEPMAEFFDADPARANIAEVAFGVNDMAEVTGCVLEDEKAGFHWAFGRSDHLGGVVGVDDFVSPADVLQVVNFLNLSNQELEAEFAPDASSTVPSLQNTGSDHPTG